MCTRGHFCDSVLACIYVNARVCTCLLVCVCVCIPANQFACPNSCVVYACEFEY